MHKIDKGVSKILISKYIRLPDNIKYGALESEPFNDLLAVSTGFRCGNDRNIGYNVERISDEFLIKYCISGSGWFETENKQYKVGAGDILVSRKDVIHRYGADEADPWSVYWTYFCGKSARFYYDWVFELRNSPVASIGYSWTAERCFQEMYSAMEKGYAPRNLLFASNSLKYLLSFLISGENQGALKEHEWKLEALVKYMMDNLGSHLTLDDLAEKYGKSKDHFIRSFYKKYGYTPIDYYNRMKIQKSCELLVTSNLSILRISEELGFSDAYYFSRLFRDKMDISPREYRKKYA